jgi:hypothetical protein
MPKMKRYLVEARFGVQAHSREDAAEIARKMLDDIVSEQYEDVLEVGYPEEDTGWVDPNPEPDDGALPTEGKTDG